MVNLKTKPAGKTYTFEGENFPSLTLREYADTWTEIPLALLPEEEQEGFVQLLTHCRADFAQNTPVLLVKAEKGVLKAVYGSALFRSGDEIVLKIGAIQVPVSQKEDKIMVGSLKGKITIVEKEDAKGEKYPTGICTLVGTDKQVFKVRVSLIQGLNASDIEATLLNEESITQFLAQVPTPTIGMHQLGVGEYEVLGTSLHEGDLGLSYKIHLENGVSVWARGNTENLLKSGWTKPEGAPLTLVISSVEEYTEGKYRVDNAFRLRLPELPSTMKTAQVVASESKDDEEDLTMGVDSSDLDQINF